MKTVRILALILALLMMVMAFAACKPTEEPVTPPETPVEPEIPDTPEEPEEPEEPAGEKVLQLVDTGVTDYVIVRDYKASQAVVDAINNLVKSIKEDTGADIVVKECFIDRPEEPLNAESEKEILVGMTTRAESATALKGLLAADYTLSVHGEKLVVGGGGDAGTIAALTVLLNKHVHEKGNRYQVKDGILQSIAFSEKENEGVRGVYSYSRFFMMDARVDSYYMFYPKGVELEQTYKQMAEELQKHIMTETGYELDVYKDNRGWADYEILIGETARTPEELYADLADNEYVIQLVKTQVTYEDGSVHDGATLYVCFGKDAYAAAKVAFTKEFMPASTTMLEKDITEPFTLRGEA
jgi:hypothetical protein